MTKNLRIIGRTISSTDSDVSSSYTIPSSSLSGFNNYSDHSAYLNSSYGVFYSWNVAVAGSGGSSGEAPYSICAKNWRLPTISEFLTLGGKYGNNSSGQLYNPPMNFESFLGFYEDNRYYANSYAQWWTSTAYSSTDAHAIDFYGKRVRDDYSNGCGKCVGFTVRCIKR